MAGISQDQCQASPNHATGIDVPVEQISLKSIDCARPLIPPLSDKPSRELMGIEAFIWRYNQGHNAPLLLDEILAAFRPYTDSFDPETGLLQVRIDDLTTSCEVFLGRDAAETGLANGLMISRPVRDARLWECVLSLMRTGNVVLFFSDDTTPLFANADAPVHFPHDLLRSLGEPKIVSSPEDILASHEG